MTSFDRGLPRVIIASSVGSIIEFYDFFIFASLAPIIAAHFYPSDKPTLGFLSTLATYAVGLAVRPSGPSPSGDSAIPSDQDDLPHHAAHDGHRQRGHRLAAGYATLGLAAPLPLILLA